VKPAARTTKNLAVIELKCPKGMKHLGDCCVIWK